MNHYTREQADRLANVAGLNDNEKRELALVLLTEGTSVMHGLWLRGWGGDLCSCSPCQKVRGAKTDTTVPELTARYAEAMVVGDFALAGRLERHLQAIIDHWDGMGARSERIARSAMYARITNPAREALGLPLVDPVANATAAVAEVA